MSMRSRAGYFSLFDGRPARALDVVAPAQREPARLADRDVDVLRRGQVALAAQEAVALVAQVEHALHLDELAGVGLVLPAALQLATLAAVTATAPAAAAVADVALLVALVASVWLFWLFWFCRLRLPCWFWPLALSVLAWRGVGAVGELGRLDEDGRSGVAGAARLAGGGGGRRRRPRPARPRSPRSPPRRSPAPSAGAPASAASASSAGRPAWRVRRDGLAPLPATAPASPLPLGGPRGHAGGVEDLVDDVGLLRPARRLERHGLGDGAELVALFAFENRSFELLFRSHRAPLLEGRRPLGCGSARGEEISGRRRDSRVNALPRITSA